MEIVFGAFITIAIMAVLSSIHSDLKKIKQDIEQLKKEG